MTTSSQGRATRRNLLAGAAGSALAAGAAVGIRAAASPDQEPVVGSRTTTATGATQAGIDRPAAPQMFGLVVVADIDVHGGLGFLPSLGNRIAALVEEAPVELLPDGPAGLTVTVGLGPRAVATRRPDGPGSEQLPAFAGDTAIDPQAKAGDLLLMAYADDPTVLWPVVNHLLGAVPGARVRWSQRCFRGSPLGGGGTIVRNPFGFHDNVQIPRTDDELADHVWLGSPMAGATLCVLRRLRLDVAGFMALPSEARERVIGRRRDGTPLSGGAPFDPVEPTAKAPNGELLVPARAHARAAHPSFTASHLMLRRGYAYDNGDGDSGLMFVSFQRDLRTFVLTQQRLDRQDDLMSFATPTATGSFLILPGYGATTPLGAGWL